MNRNIITGIAFAIFATIVWSGNFIVARSQSQLVPPLALAFFRWACAALFLLPIASSQFWKERQIIFTNWQPLFWAALFGISLFNTFVYTAGHFSSAINMALIGTTSSPIFSLILARIFLKEHIPWQRWVGLGICLVGILLLISKGHIQTLITFQFSTGDGWILLGAFCFAVYNIFARKKPAALSPLSYLFSTFWMGTLILLPFFFLEKSYYPPIVWSWQLAAVILYLGLGTSVVAFFCWNAAIARLGAARTALFGNLIPAFSSVEAVWLLHEKISPIQGWAMAIIIGGLIVANANFRTLFNNPNQ